MNQRSDPDHIDFNAKEDGRQTGSNLPHRSVGQFPQPTRSLDGNSEQMVILYWLVDEETTLCAKADQIHFEIHSM